MRRLTVPIAVLAALVLGAALARGAGAPVIFTIAGADRGGYAGDGGPATDASLNGPAGVLRLSGGELLVADTINQRIRRIDARGRISTLAGSGKRGSSGDGGAPSAAAFQDPTALALGGPGVLVADTANSQVRSLALPAGTVGTVAGTGESGFAGDGGPARDAQLNEPAGIAVLGDTVFVADTGNNRIRAIDGAGTIRTIAGTGAAGFAGDGGPAAAAQLNRPAGLAIGDAGLLIADSGNNRIRVIRADGTIATLAGTGAASSGGDGGPAQAAALNRPMDVAARGSELFIAETGGNRVRRVDASGVISRLAGAGGPRHGGDGGAPAKALLNAPRSVEIGPGGGDLVIADTDNNRLRYVVVPNAGAHLALAAVKPSLLAPLRKAKRTVNGREVTTRVVSDVKLAFRMSAGGKVAIVIRIKKCGCTVATLRHSGAPGLNVPSLPKRLREGRRRLTKDVYSVTLTATDSGGRVATKRMELIVR